MLNLGATLEKMIRPDGSIASRDMIKTEAKPETQMDVGPGARLAAFKANRRKPSQTFVDNKVCPYCDGHRVLLIDSDWMIPINQGGTGGIPRGLDIAPYVRMRGGYVGPGATFDHQQMVYCSCHPGKVKRSAATGGQMIEETVPTFDTFFHCPVWDTEYGQKLVAYRDKRSRKAKLTRAEYEEWLANNGLDQLPASGPTSQYLDLQPEEMAAAHWSDSIPDPPENNLYEDDDAPPF